jgi:hypothetical protein
MGSRSLLRVRTTAYGGYCCKSLFGGRTKFFRAADAFCVRRCEGPYRLIQNRTRTSVVALKSDAAAERSKINFREIFRVVRFSTFATISGVKQTLQLKASRTDFDRCAYDHMRVRPLGPQGWGVVKSLELSGSGPVGLLHTQNFGIKFEKPHERMRAAGGLRKAFHSRVGHRRSLRLALALLSWI